jgi:hypothetical protein
MEITEVEGGLKALLSSGFSLRGICHFWPELAESRVSSFRQAEWTQVPTACLHLAESNKLRPTPPRPYAETPIALPSHWHWH